MKSLKNEIIMIDNRQMISELLGIRGWRESVMAKGILGVIERLVSRSWWWLYEFIHVLKFIELYVQKRSM